MFTSVVENKNFHSPFLLVIVFSLILLFKSTSDKNDSIVALANKSIQLSCQETIGMDATQIALTADKVYLGSSEGDEGTSLQSAILGENLITQLTQLVTSLKSLATSVTNAIDSNGAPISDFIVVGTSLKATCDDILKVLNKKPNTNGSLLSNKVKIRQ